MTRPTLLEVFICYNFLEGLTNEEEDQHLPLQEDLFAVGLLLCLENWVE
jgi:hypothetical protein